MQNTKILSKREVKCLKTASSHKIINSQGINILYELKKKKILINKLIIVRKYFYCLKKIIIIHDSSPNDT